MELECDNGPNNPRKLCDAKEIRLMLSDNVRLYRKGYESSNDMRLYKGGGHPVNYSRYSRLMNTKIVPTAQLHFFSCKVSQCHHNLNRCWDAMISVCRRINEITN